MPDVADSHLMDYWKHQARQDLESEARESMPKGWAWKSGLTGAALTGIPMAVAGLGAGGPAGAVVGGLGGATFGGVLGALMGHAAQKEETRRIEEARGALMQPESELEKYLANKATERYMEYQDELARASAPVTNVTTNVHGYPSGMAVA